MATILKTMLLRLLTKKFLSTVIILLLESISSRTDNKVDDQLVSAVKEAING
jgi:hypothetical protein